MRLAASLGNDVGGVRGERRREKQSGRRRCLAAASAALLVALGGFRRGASVLTHVAVGGSNQRRSKAEQREKRGKLG
jgi:hypothetical protein